MLNQWIPVEPIHCHKRLKKNTLIEKVRYISKDKKLGELIVKVLPKELEFFYDHGIDHIPGMLSVCVMRQSSLVIAHVIYKVPMDYIAIMEWMKIKLYCYGELDIPTIVKSETLNLNEKKNKKTFILKGTMIQKNNIIMKTVGKLIMLNPLLARKIRYKKVKLEEIKRREDDEFFNY